MQNLRCIIALSVFFIGIFCGAQNSHPDNLKTLDRLINEEKYDEALTTLNLYSTELHSKKSYYELADYIYYVGKINLQLHDKNKATQEALAFIKNIVSKTDSVKVKRQTQLELGSYYELIGDSKKAYDCNYEALELTKKMPGAKAEHFGMVESNLGTLATRKGDIIVGINHYKTALKHYESDAKANNKNFYSIYNSLGGSMWYVSKIDSALYYYQKAEKALSLLEPDPVNLYYRPAILNNNIAGIYSSQGNLEKALQAMRSTINSLNLFVKSPDITDSKREQGREFLFMAIDNYGGIYKDIGNYEKAKELLEYAYREKRKHFDPENSELFKSKVLLGQIYYELKDYNLAGKYLDEGIAHINRVDGGNAFWSADAHYAKALVAQDLGNAKAAKTHYEKAEHYYETALQGAYDELYLDFITKASHFYAKNGNKTKALTMAQKAYEYIKENQGETTSFEIQQVLNMGEIYYELGDYRSALEKGKTSVELLKKTLPTQTNPLDSTKIIFYKPQAILLQSQATYKLRNKKDAAFLKKEFDNIKNAISILEQQKPYAGENNVSTLINNNAPLFEYSKKLALELYNTTKEDAYLNELISLHESILYNRIRAQLNSRASMTYANLPAEVLKQEKAIQAQLKNALNKPDGMEAFFKANTEWTSYLEMLKKEHPKYYKLRFASISNSLKNIAQQLPNNTTAVRYMFVDNTLYAAVISRQSTRLFKLKQDNVVSNIIKLQDENNLFENHYKTLNDLYTNLWKPFENDIKTSKVIIIPDRELFNLNFEMLTPQLVSSYKELATQSLLSKHIISYNYSLFLIGKGSKTVGYKDNFVAFVPEFNDEMKKDYKVAVSDSLDLDISYLTLLPQPFTKMLAKNSTRLFGGKSFLNGKSTVQIFKNRAKEHKIIHIGTHAESNNISPELSRLVFAKSLKDNGNDDNYLYTYEIYNTNLSSNLAILTACETGKPAYQPGEGMISLAHAFNYAGSESILTSLWKIDEQSSAKIVSLFYENIKKGWSKDKALQQAKLQYIATAQGRTLHPQYWAGLVLIGDTSPVDIKASSSLTYWLIGLAILFMSLFIFSRTRKIK